MRQLTSKGDLDLFVPIVAYSENEPLYMHMHNEAYTTDNTKQIRTILKVTKKKYKKRNNKNNSKK